MIAIQKHHDIWQSGRGGNVRHAFETCISIATSWLSQDSSTSGFCLLKCVISRSIIHNDDFRDQLLWDFINDQAHSILLIEGRDDYTDVGVVQMRP